MKQVEQLLTKQEVQINNPSALNVAAKQDDAKMVSLLLKHGADVNHRPYIADECLPDTLRGEPTFQGYLPTALHYAVKNRNKEMVRYVLLLDDELQEDLRAQGREMTPQLELIYSDEPQQKQKQTALLLACDILTSPELVFISHHVVPCRVASRLSTLFALFSSKLACVCFR